MKDHLPPLIIVGSFPDTFSLSDLLQSSLVEKNICQTKEKYPDLDRHKIITDGMVFELDLFSEEETENILNQNCGATLFGTAAEKGSAGIGLWLGEHLENGRHLPSINRALLKVAKILGQAVSATHICWHPARQSIDFGHFEEAVDDYLAGGPTPILIQIAITKNTDSALQTQGLSYFSNQEITLAETPNLSESEALKRLVRISHDIAINGKIDNVLEVDGLDKGERITFKPSRDSSELAIKISAG
jgi:hypothetical protein